MIAESNIIHRDSKGVIRKWIDQKTGEVRTHPDVGEDQLMDVPKGTKLSKGIYYFNTFKKARQWAKDKKWPTDRINAFGVGWAIQSREGGHYAGPGWNPPVFSKRDLALKAQWKKKHPGRRRRSRM